MTRAMQKQIPLPTRTAVLIVERTDGWRTSYTLESGKSVIVGRGNNCGLRLEGDNLAGIHCMLRLHDGDLLLQDWFSRTGTQVNGQPSHGEVRVPADAVIQVGDYVIRAEIHTHDDRAETPAAAASPALPNAAQSELKLEHEKLLEKMQAVIAENQLLRDEVQRLSARQSDRAPGEDDPFVQETIELLRAEVEQLQTELLHRPASCDVATAADPDANPAASAADHSVQLVERLDDLLSELNQSDQRIATLEDLLRISEEATEAEREERRQLECWVNDIECRIGHREIDWKSEADMLRQQLAASNQQQRDVEQRLAKATSAASDDERIRTEIENWRTRGAELQDKLAESEQQRVTLNQKLRELQEQLTSAHDATQLEPTLREERVTIAQERAELARQRAELAALRAHLQQHTAVQQSSERDVDNRMRAFREHLREIHDQEQTETPRPPTLSARIAQLWKRLDG